MKKITLISKEEALKRARSQKDKGESGTNMFYALLHNAHPAMLEFFEDQLAVAIQAGTAMGEYMANLESGTPEHAEFLRMAHEAVSKTSFARRRQPEEQTEEHETVDKKEEAPLNE